MNTRNHWERRDARVTSEVARRAIRRLDVLEWVILAAAAGLAIGGGALVATLIVRTEGWPFRPVWFVTTLVLFVVPGAIALLRMKREERRLRERRDDSTKDDDG